MRVCACELWPGWGRPGGVAVLIVALAGLWSGAASGQNIVRVEEDWGIALNEPENAVDSPQFHTTISPVGSLDLWYFQVTWNYREDPEFEAGGLQLQAWDGDTMVQARTCRTEPLSTYAELIFWTQSMELTGGTLHFRIANGYSTTWGAFGPVQISTTAGLESLNEYDTDLSVENSCITYGSNRVNALVLFQVRKYDASGALVSIDARPRVVYVLYDYSGE